MAIADGSKEVQMLCGVFQSEETFPLYAWRESISRAGGTQQNIS
jgi:hypothetical protein